jgi:pyrroloquinoline quinone (PQQ) biosynthesis protein C
MRLRRTHIKEYGIKPGTSDFQKQWKEKGIPTKSMTTRKQKYQDNWITYLSLFHALCNFLHHNREDQILINL